jgi:hypothetical protein
VAKHGKRRPVAAPFSPPTKEPRVAGDLSKLLGKGKSPYASADPAVVERHVMGLNPSWRISILETKDPYGWHTIDMKTFEHIQERLKNFESMTWSDILLDGKKQNHSVAVDRLCKQAKDRLEELRLFPVEKLVSLRLSARGRIWGIPDPKEKAVLKLLWWDPRHEICPSLKKYT